MENPFNSVRPTRILWLQKKVFSLKKIRYGTFHIYYKYTLQKYADCSINICYLMKQERVHVEYGRLTYFSMLTWAIATQIMVNESDSNVDWNQALLSAGNIFFIDADCYYSEFFNPTYLSTISILTESICMSVVYLFMAKFSIRGYITSWLLYYLE